MRFQHAAAKPIASASNLWPTDPPTIPASPSWSTVDLGVTTGSGGGPGESVFHPTFGNRICYTPSGDILCVFNDHDEDATTEHTITSWKLVKIASPYTSASTLFTTASLSEQTIGMCPTIHCDINGTTYLVLNQYPRPTGTSRTRVYKIPAPYTVATLIYSSTQSSNKYTHCFDQFRQILWMSWWEASAPNTLVGIDLNGNVVKTMTLWNTPGAGDTPPYAGPEAYGWVTYHTLHVNHQNGEMYMGYVAEASERLGTECFYNVSHIYCPDPTAPTPAWFGLNGQVSLPVYADDSGAANKKGFPWTTQGTYPASGNADFLNGADAQYAATFGFAAGHYNWNHPNGMALNKNNLHVVYMSTGNPFGGEHHVYARWNRATQSFDYRRYPDFNTDSGTHTGIGTAGSFCQGTSQKGPLFYVTTGRADQAHVDQLMAMRCDDSAATTPVWTQHGGFSAHLGQAPNNDGFTGNGLTNVNSTWLGPDGAINVICGQADDGAIAGTGNRTIFARLA